MRKQLLMNMKRVHTSCMLILLVLMVGITARSQASYGTVNGIVRNEKGVPLSGVSVVATNNKAKFSIGTQSDSAGYFSFARLPAGTAYNFTFTSVGYQNEVINGYDVKQGTTVSLVAKLI